MLRVRGLDDCAFEMTKNLLGLKFHLFTRRFDGSIARLGRRAHL